MNRQKQTDERLLLTFGDAAARLQLSRTTIYDLVKRGELPTVRVGRAVRIPTLALSEWIARHTDMIQGKEAQR